MGGSSCGLAFVFIIGLVMIARNMWRHDDLGVFGNATSLSFECSEISCLKLPNCRGLSGSSGMIAGLKLHEFFVPKLGSNPTSSNSPKPGNLNAESASQTPGRI